MRTYTLAREMKIVVGIYIAVRTYRTVTAFYVIFLFAFAKSECTRQLLILPKHMAYHSNIFECETTTHCKIHVMSMSYFI